MKSVASSRGQITIPAAVQRALGLRPGTPVEFALQAGGVLVRKGTPKTRGVDRVYGLLRGLGPTDELLGEMRGPGPRAPAGRRRG